MPFYSFYIPLFLYSDNCYNSLQFRYMVSFNSNEYVFLTFKVFRFIIDELGAEPFIGHYFVYFELNAASQEYYATYYT